MTYSKQEKINRIYEVIANKELSFGCKLMAGGENWKIDSETKVSGDRLIHCDDNGCESYFVYKIIGHPVMIGDCLDWIINKNENPWEYESLNRRLMISWDYKRMPIDDQREGCIDYIYSLIK